MAHLMRGAIHFPLPGNKSSPRTFKGKFNEVKTFIEHYERLCAQYYVSNHREKLDNIGQYCNRLTREFMEALPSFKAGDWDQFTQDLMEYYDAEQDEKRYSWRDLEAYAKKNRSNTHRVNLAYWKIYSRGFIRISGWLSYHNKVSEREQALYFWKGIPRNFRNKLESRLIATHPDHDMEEPFDIVDVQRAAKTLLKRNRFDSDKLWSDEEQEDSGDDYPSDSEQDSDSDSEFDYYSRRKPKKHDSIKTSHKSKQVSLDESPKAAVTNSRSTSKGSSKDSDKEVEDIIGRLNRMSIDDPTYAIHYFRAYQLNPIIADLVPKPIDRIKAFQSSPPIRNGGQQGRQAPPPVRTGANAYQRGDRPSTLR